MSAVIKTHWKVKRRPRLRVREHVPYVEMVALMTACSVKLLCGFPHSPGEDVVILTLSASVDKEM